MARAYLTRVLEFTAAHRLRRADWPEERNQTTFGTATRDHEHRYQVRVTVVGNMSETEGGVVALSAFDRLLATEITDRLDGRHLNDDIPEFAEGRRLPTGEALAVYLWERIGPRLPEGVALHAVRVQEGPDLYAEYLGEG